MADYNIGNVVGLLKQETAPSKTYVLWGKILNPSFPDIVDIHYYDEATLQWTPITSTTINYLLKAVIDNTVVGPPGVPTDGDRYLIPNSGTTGDWIGKENQIAEYRLGVWVYTTPLDGYLVMVRTEANKLYEFQGTYGSGGVWFVHDFQVPVAPGTYVPYTVAGLPLGYADLDSNAEVPNAYINEDALSYNPATPGNWGGGINTVKAALDYLILQSGGGGTATIFVADITARDGLSPGTGQEVYVFDASGDPTVVSGPATYSWTGSVWVKTGEGESMDISYGLDKQITYNAGGVMVGNDNFLYDYSNDNLQLGNTSGSTSLIIGANTYDDYDINLNKTSASKIRLQGDSDLDFYNTITKEASISYDVTTKDLTIEAVEATGEVHLKANATVALTATAGGKVKIAAPTPGTSTTILTRNATSGEIESVDAGDINPTLALDELTDVDTTGLATGSMLYYDSTNWVDTGSNLTWNGSSLLISNGAQATPSIAFSGDTGTGIYTSNPATNLRISISGSPIHHFSATTFQPVFDNTVQIGAAGNRYSNLYVTGINTGTALNNQVVFQAYDTDAPGFVAFATLKAGTTPTFDLSVDTTMGSNAIHYDGLYTTLSGYGISDTKANFNTAVSDGLILFQGDYGLGDNSLPNAPNNDWNDATYSGFYQGHTATLNNVYGSFAGMIHVPSYSGTNAYQLASGRQSTHILNIRHESNGVWSSWVGIHDYTTITQTMIDGWDSQSTQFNFGIGDDAHNVYLRSFFMGNNTGSTNFPTGITNFYSGIAAMYNATDGSESGWILGSNRSSAAKIFHKHVSNGVWYAWSQLWDDNDFTSTDITNWGTAYGWGDHSGLYLPIGGGTLTGSLTINGATPANLILDQADLTGVGNSDSGTVTMVAKHWGTSNIDHEWRMFAETSVSNSDTNSYLRIQNQTNGGGWATKLSINTSDGDTYFASANAVLSWANYGSSIQGGSNALTFRGITYNWLKNGNLAHVIWNATNYTWYDDDAQTTAILDITRTTGAASFSGSVTANSFIKSGGAVTEFLKADGSVDTNTYLTSFTETNDLTAAVIWANVPDANITQSSVTQHQSALSIAWSQITGAPTYDNYVSWTAAADTGSDAVTTGQTLTFAGGANITTSLIGTTLTINGAASGTIGGSVSGAGEIVYSNGTDTVASSSQFYYTANAAQLYNISSETGLVSFSLQNNNTSTGSAAQVITAAGASSGDPYIVFNLTSNIASYAIGIDNSDVNSPLNITYATSSATPSTASPLLSIATDGQFTFNSNVGGGTATQYLNAAGGWTTPVGTGTIGGSIVTGGLIPYSNGADSITGETGFEYNDTSNTLLVDNIEIHNIGVGTNGTISSNSTGSQIDISSALAVSGTLRGASIDITTTPNAPTFSTAQLLARDASGVVRALAAAGTSTSRYLKDDGTWDTPTDNNDIDYINSASWNSSSGLLTLSGLGNAGATAAVTNLETYLNANLNFTNNPGIFTGSIASTQIAYGTAANTIGGSANFTYGSFVSITQATSNQYQSPFKIYSNNGNARIFIEQPVAGIDAYMNIYFRDSSNANKIQLSPEGYTYFNGGNVGIGTATPAQLLEVRHSENIASHNFSINTLRLTSYDNSGSFWNTQGVGLEFYIDSSGGTGGLVASIEGHAAVTNPTDGDLLFLTATSSSLTEKMRIQEDGKVGIGTTLPDSKLEVSGAADNTIKSTSVGDYFPGISIERTNGTTKTTKHFQLQIGSTGNFNFKDITSGYYPMVFGNTGDVLLAYDSSGLNPRMFIDQSTGNIGVGPDFVTGTNAKLGVDYPSTSAYSVTWGATAGQILRNENREFAFGLHNASPYHLYIQGRTSTSSGTGIVINPLGGNVGVGIMAETLFHIKASSPILKIQHDGTSSSATSRLMFDMHTTTSSYYKSEIRGYRDGTSYGTHLRFYTRPNTTGDTIREVARFNNVGQLDVRANIVGNSTVYSDINLKKDIEYIDDQDALKITLGMKGITYHDKYGDFTDKLKSSYIAQEIEVLIPHITHKSVNPFVTDGKTEYKTISITDTLPYISGAISALHTSQETQAQKIKRLTKRVEYLENKLNIK